MIKMCDRLPGPEYPCEIPEYPDISRSSEPKSGGSGFSPTPEFETELGTISDSIRNRRIRSLISWLIPRFNTRVLQLTYHTLIWWRNFQFCQVSMIFCHYHYRRDKHTLHRLRWARIRKGKEVAILWIATEHSLTQMSVQKCTSLCTNYIAPGREYIGECLSARDLPKIRWIYNFSLSLIFLLSRCI